MLCTRCRALPTISSTLLSSSTLFSSSTLLHKPPHPSVRTSWRTHSQLTDGQILAKSHRVGQPPPQIKQLKKWELFNPLLFISAITFGLGVWQILRREEKLAFIEMVEARTKADPTPFDSSVEYLELTPVQIQGVYDYSHEFFLGPRCEVLEHEDQGESGGYHSIVPMTLLSGERILVDRGWCLKRKKSPTGAIEGQVTQTGYIVYPEKAMMPAFAPTPGSSTTYIWRATDVMAEIAATLPVTVELMEGYTQDDVNGPLSGQTRFSVYNKHVEYILTWFIISFVGFGYVIASKRRASKILRSTT